MTFWLNDQYMFCKCDKCTIWTFQGKEKIDDDKRPCAAIF